jgi:hypothetical protein
VLWVYLARARSGQSARDLLRGDAGPLDRTAWPWPIVDVYLGNEDAAGVLAAARRGDQSAQKDRECEADFYLGAKAASEGNSTAAREFLQRAPTICPPTTSKISRPSSGWRGCGNSCRTKILSLIPQSDVSTPLGLRTRDTDFRPRVVMFRLTGTGEPAMLPTGQGPPPENRQRK